MRALAVRRKSVFVCASSRPTASTHTTVSPTLAARASFRKSPFILSPMQSNGADFLVRSFGAARMGRRSLRVAARGPQRPWLGLTKVADDPCHLSHCDSRAINHTAPPESPFAAKQVVATRRRLRQRDNPRHLDSRSTSPMSGACDLSAGCVHKLRLALAPLDMTGGSGAGKFVQCTRTLCVCVTLFTCSRFTPQLSCVFL